MEKVSKPMAKLFYEQCAGSTSGHMAMIPNNPMIFGLVAAHAERNNGPHSCTKEEFADFLRSAADSLTTDT